MGRAYRRAFGHARHLVGATALPMGAIGQFDVSGPPDVSDRIRLAPGRARAPKPRPCHADIAVLWLVSRANRWPRAQRG